MTLGFAGTPEFAVPALEALIASRHRVVAVFTQPDRPAGRGLALQSSAVKRRALACQVPVMQPQSFKTPEALEMLKRLALDALVVVAYGQILPPAVLAVPRLGCFNIHASLLPRWRGAAPIQRALLAGDPVTGVTLMQMEAGLDTGPILAVRQIDVEERETGGTLHDRLARLGAALIVDVLDAAQAGGAPARPQPPEGATYAPKISKAEALIDWRAAAAELLRRVRAFNPWPIAETRLHGAQVRLWDAELSPVGATTEAPAAPGTVLAASAAGIDVACGQGALRILRLQLAGRKPQSAGDFIRARQLVGATLAAS